MFNSCLASSTFLSFISYGEVYGSKLGLSPLKKGKERILFPLTSSISSYDIRMITVIILVIIILYLHQYLLMQMQWMYLTLYSVSTWVSKVYFSHSWRGRSQSDDVWNVRVEFAAKTLLPWRTDICCLSKSLVWVRNERVCVCVCVWGWEKKDIWVFDSILVLLKSVLIFHRRGFYGTDSIHEKSDGQSYFSNTKKCS